jgi:hypothetical protein
MKVSEEWLKLFEEFNKNWAANRPELAFSGDKEKWIESEDHQFLSELKGICQGNGGSLPYFTNQSITWCSLAISPIQLKQQGRKPECLDYSKLWLDRGQATVT